MTSRSYSQLRLYYNRGYIGVILRLHWDNGKENGNYKDYRGYIGIIGLRNKIQHNPYMIPVNTSFSVRCFI